MTDFPESAILMGATGLVGATALPLLTKQFSTVWTPGRRSPDTAPANSQFIQTDFSDLELLDDVMVGVPAVLCIAFGTTIRQAGSQERFREIDYEYPLAIARWAVSLGTRRICLISAVGADARSRVFYNRVKGELENALRDMPLQSLHILRPSLLLGSHPGRPMEAIGQTFLGPLAPILPARIRPIRATQVAQKLADTASDKQASGVHVLEGRPLLR